MRLTQGRLTIDLTAIVHNWQAIDLMVGASTLCGAVVKANAYGLGVAPVSTALFDAGCRHFFVANVDEAVVFRSILGDTPAIYTLLGFSDGEESLLLAHNIQPVLSSVCQLQAWLVFVRSQAGRTSVRSVLKINTGMTRLGLDVDELSALIQSQPESLCAAGIDMVMTHFACADEPEHPLNQQQLDQFHSVISMWRACSSLPDVKFSMANSAALLFMSPSYFDMVRPGIALYGGAPESSCISGDAITMRPVVNLALPVLQLRRVSAGVVVGYGATHIVDGERWIATVAGGYADGIPRALSNKAFGYIAGIRVPLIGRVSMDSCMFDVTDACHLPLQSMMSDQVLSVELLGEHCSINQLADIAGTIGYEILTSLGSRYQRHYAGAG